MRVIPGQIYKDTKTNTILFMVVAIYKEVSLVLFPSGYHVEYSNKAIANSIVDGRLTEVSE